MLLKPYEELPFTIEEGVFWLDNAERIYAGDFKRSELIFFRSNTTKCFFDFSVFDNINIRNALLLYDTVYIAPPLSDKMDEFLMKQKMTFEELVELVEMGKVVLLLLEKLSSTLWTTTLSLGNMINSANLLSTL